MPARPENRLLLDFGDEHVLGQAGLHQLDHLAVHGIHDGCGPADERHLVVALHHALPVDESRRVREGCLAQMGAERVVGGGGEPVIVHLDADPRRLPAARRDHARELLHRMLQRVLHIGVVIAHDIVVAHEDGALGALGIHAASPPDGFALKPQQHAPGAHRRTSRHSP